MSVIEVRVFNEFSVKPSGFNYKVVVDIIKKISIHNFLIWGFIFFLPLNENVNTWFLIGLIIATVLSLDNWKKLKIRTIAVPFIIFVPGLLFLLKLLGLFRALNIQVWIDDIVRAITLFVLPIWFYLLSKKSKNLNDSFFFNPLIAGSLISILICWANSISSVIRNNEPFINIIGWKRSNIYLTKIIDIHPPYLGIIIATCIIYLFFNLYRGRRALKISVILIMLLFMLNLAARNAIFFLIIAFITFCLFKRNWSILVGVVILSFGFVVVIDNNQTSFFQRKYIRMLNPDDQIADQRFTRLKASWSVFKDYPILGAGQGRDDVLRLEKYKSYNDSLAVEKNYNAHNQYLEYLSTYGMVGLLVFLFVIIFFLQVAIRNRCYLYSTLMFLFCFACLTESLLERELGVKYFSFILGLIVYFDNPRIEEEINGV